LWGGGMMRGVSTYTFQRTRLQRFRRGQSAVETALVFPLFLFCMMGFFQIMLMHQARLVTKYAAYKAVRAGALQRNDTQKMTQAALAVVAPMTLLSANGRMGSIERFDEMSTNRYDSGPEVVKVTICGPTQGMVRNGIAPQPDFDEPSATGGANSDWGNAAANTGDWRAYDSNKLYGQVLYNYRMFIPFVNGLLFHLVRAEEKVGVMENTRVGTRYTAHQKESASKDANGNERTVQSGDYGSGNGNYFMPIRASYTMRMHSNVTTDSLPGSNECVIPFKRL
jgi:hypothetical protein